MNVKTLKQRWQSQNSGTKSALQRFIRASPSYSIKHKWTWVLSHIYCCLAVCATYKLCICNTLCNAFFAVHSLLCNYFSAIIAAHYLQYICCNAFVVMHLLQCIYFSAFVAVFFNWFWDITQSLLDLIESVQFIHIHKTWLTLQSHFRSDFRPSEHSLLLHFQVDLKEKIIITL